MKRALGFGLVLLSVSAAQALAAGLALPTPTRESGGAHLLMAAAARGAAGYLGISVRDVAQDEIAALKLKDARGAEIVLVDHDAPAGKAGLRERDVILSMNGRAIAGQDQLRRMLRECAPGSTIVLVVSRDGQQKTVAAQMAVSQEEVEREASEQRLSVSEPQDQPVPDASESALGPLPSAPPMRGGNSFIGTLLMNPSCGAMLEKMSPQLADYFGVPNGNGLLVRSVLDGSPAALAGMHAGDVVIRADSRLIVSTGDWAKAIKSSHGHPLTIIVLRDKKEQTLTLTPDSRKRSSLEVPHQSSGDSDPTAVARLGLALFPRS